MRKLLAFSLCCILALMAFSASALEIDFWNGFTGSDGEILTEIVNRYNENNERGDIIKMDIIPWANFHEQLPPAIATGTAPALVAFNNDMLTSYVGTGSILPVDDFYEKTGLDRNNVSTGVLDMVMLDGIQWQIPMQAYGYYLYWNKDLFAAADLDPEQPPATWTELYEFAEKLTDSEKNIWGFGFPTDNTHVYGNQMIGYGGYFVKDDEVGINSEIGKKVFSEIGNAAAKGIAPPATTGPDLDNLLFAGQLALYTNGPWCINGCETHELNYGLSILPAGDAGQPGRGMLAGTAFAIPVGTSEEEKEAAYAFMAFWNSDAICKEWSIRNGFPPYLLSVLEDEEVKNNKLLSETAKGLVVSEENMHGVSQASEINNDVIRPMYERIINGADVASELKATEDAIKMIIG